MRRMIAVSKSSLTEMRRGVLPFCVLAALRNGEAYAFDLVRTLSTEELLTSEGTIYPLLSRLRRDEWVTTSWRESEAGPPRRYYRMTDRGKQALEAFAAEWGRFRDAVDSLTATEGAGG